MQHPLVFGVAGHNYLVLRNDKNEIQKELHGLATDSINGGWKYYGTDKGDLLKVWEFNSPRYYVAQKNYAGIILLRGNESEVKTYWSRSYTCKDAINEKNIPYPPYGIKVRGDTENSNSVAFTLLRCMELSPKHLGLFTPGWGNDLLNEMK